MWIVLSQADQCCCTADTAVACAWVVLEWYAAREAAVEMVDEEAVEELSVVVAVNTELPCVLIGKCPADIVMTADVVDPLQCGRAGCGGRLVLDGAG